MIVGVAIGCLLLAALATLYVFSMKSFAAMANYSDLNEKSRYASDLISRDIRSSASVDPATTTTTLVLKAPDSTTTTYTYDAGSGTLSRSQSGQTKLLLAGVDSLSFALYEKPNVGDPYEKFPQATISSTKLIGFQWSCSRKLVGSQNNSESLEAAIVEMRNK
jgi:hypothetical protein